MASLAVVAFAAFLPVSIAGIQISWWLAALGLGALWAAGERFRPTALAAPLAFHAVTIGLSLVFAAWPGDGLESRNVWRLAAIPVLAWALSRDRRAARNALVALVVVALAVAPYAVAQYFTGIDWLRVTDKTVRYAAAFAEGRYRPVGAYNAYPSFAFVYSSIGLIAAAAAVAVKGRLRLLLGFAAALLIGTALLAQVRAAWMGAAAGLVAMAWLHSQRAVLRTVAVVVVLGGLTVAAVPTLRAKALATADFSYANNRDRVFMWARALEMVSDHPVTGVGHGSWTSSTEWYFDRWEPAFPVRCHAHDNFLHFWATTGPFGLVGFVWLLLAHFRQSAGAYRRSRDEDPLAATAALAGVGVAAAFVGYAFTQDPYFDGEVYYAFALALALGAVAARWSGMTSPLGPVGSRIAGVAVPTGLGLLAASVARPVFDAPGGLSPALLAVPAGLAGALALVSMDRRLLTRLTRDAYLQAVLLTAAFAALFPLLVITWLAPAADVPHVAVPAGWAVALVGLGTAVAARSFVLVHPRPGGALAGVGALLAAGLLWQALPADEPTGSGSSPAAARPDLDADGVPDGIDNCMEWNPSQTDTSGDGLGDACAPVVDVVQLGDAWWGVTPDLLLALRTEGAELRGRVAKTFPAWADLVAIAEGRFLDDRRLLAIASRWNGDITLLEPEGPKRVLRHDFGAEAGWTALATARTGAASAPLLLAASEGVPRLWAFEVRPDRLVRRGRATASGGFQAIAAVDVDGDGRDEVLATAGSGDAPSRLQVRSLTQELPLLWASNLSFPAIRIDAGQAPDGTAWIRVLGRGGEVELWTAGPGGLQGPLETQRVEGGVRWLLDRGGTTWAYRTRDPALVALPPSAQERAP